MATTAPPTTRPGAARRGRVMSVAEVPQGAPAGVVGERVVRPLYLRTLDRDGRDVALGHPSRPTWRGAVHLAALVVAVPSMAVLIGVSGGARARMSVIVYALGLCSMLAISVTYHRWTHRLCTRSAWRRADHAAIFGAIAGSATPIVLFSHRGAAGVVLVSILWVLALLGAVCKLSRRPAGDRAGSVVYALLSAAGAIAVPSLWQRHGALTAMLVIAGGAVYIAGAVCFARRWPTLRAAVFSYHEVWHCATVLAAALQFAAIWRVVS